MIKFIKDQKITYQEVNVFFDELYSNQKDQKQIFEEVKALFQERSSTTKYTPEVVLNYISKRMKNLKQIYKDKCIARKEISEDEIVSIEIVIRNQYCDIKEEPNITTIFDNLLDMGFNYGGIIKDRTTGKILAGNIYIYEYYHSFSYFKRL